MVINYTLSTRLHHDPGCSFPSYTLRLRPPLPVDDPGSHQLHPLHSSTPRSRLVIPILHPSATVTASAARVAGYSHLAPIGYDHGTSCSSRWPLLLRIVIARLAMRPTCPWCWLRTFCESGRAKWSLSGRLVLGVDDMSGAMKL